MALTNIEISDQVDGITSSFTTTGEDLATGEAFFAFLNGNRVNEDEVTTVDEKNLTLSFVPESGDTLELQYDDILTDQDIAGT